MKTQTSGVVETLCFHETELAVVSLDGEVWLRGSQIGAALEYEEPSRSINRIYSRHAKQFDDGMSRMARLRDICTEFGATGQFREVRCFSLRGAHLLGIMAKTSVALQFSFWALDVLHRRSAREQSGPVSHSHRLAYLKEASTLVRMLEPVTCDGLGRMLYTCLQQVSEIVGIKPEPLEILAPRLRAQALPIGGN